MLINMLIDWLFAPEIDHQQVCPCTNNRLFCQTCVLEWNRNCANIAIRKAGNYLYCAALIKLGSAYPHLI